MIISTFVVFIFDLFQMSWGVILNDKMSSSIHWSGRPNVSRQAVGRAVCVRVCVRSYLCEVCLGEEELFPASLNVFFEALDLKVKVKFRLKCWWISVESPHKHRRPAWVCVGN